MGKRKKVGDQVEAPQANRPFCYFCDRTFHDEGTLIQHQRAKHFRCQECDDSVARGKCESVQGLIVHTLKQHAKSLAKVPHAIAGRDSPSTNVYGMDGIPVEILKEKGIERPEPLGAAAPPTQAQPPMQAQAQDMSAFMGSGMLAPCQAAGMPSLPPMPGVALAPSGPSVSGFQQFLAAQQAPPGMGGAPPLPMPGAPSVFAGAFAPQAPPALALDGHLQALPLPAGMPVVAGSTGGMPGQLLPQTRILEEAAGEDVSVEERRALLDRYRVSR